MKRENHLLGKLINCKCSRATVTGLDHLRTAMILHETDQNWPEALNAALNTRLGHGKAELRIRKSQWRSNTCISQDTFETMCDYLNNAPALGGPDAAKAIENVWDYTTVRDNEFVDVFKTFYDSARANTGANTGLSDTLAHFSSRVGAPPWMKPAEAAGLAAEMNDVAPIQFLVVTTAAIFHQECEPIELRRPDDPDARALFKLALGRAAGDLRNLGVAWQLYALSVAYDLARVSRNAFPAKPLSMLETIGLLSFEEATPTS